MNTISHFNDLIHCNLIKMLTKSNTPSMIIIELFPEYKINKLKISLNFASFCIIRRRHYF